MRPDAAIPRRRVLRWSGAALLTTVALAVPTSAHHSQARLYDNTRKIEVVGVVSKILLKNPHSTIYLDEKTPSRLVQWEVELGPPTALTRSGLRPEVLYPGLKVKVVGQPARAAGSRTMCCVRITRPDGTPLVAP